MKAIVLALALVMALGCSHKAKQVGVLTSDGAEITCVYVPERDQYIEVSRYYRGKAKPDLMAWEVHNVLLATPLYHRQGTQWLAWLADGRPNEEGS